MHKLNLSAAELREDYLDEADREFRGSMTNYELREYRMEIRNHLDELAQAYQELGMTENEAMWHAIKRFGTAQKIGELNRLEKRFRFNLVGFFAGILTTISTSYLSITLLGNALFSLKLVSNATTSTDLQISIVYGSFCYLLACIFYSKIKSFLIVACSVVSICLSLWYAPQAVAVGGETRSTALICVSVFVLANLTLFVASKASRLAFMDIVANYLKAKLK